MYIPNDDKQKLPILQITISGWIVWATKWTNQYDKRPQSCSANEYENVIIELCGIV